MTPTMTTVLLSIMGGAFTVVGIVVTFLLYRKLTGAQVDDTSASALERKANAEATSSETQRLAAKDLVETVERLDRTVGAMQSREALAFGHIIEVHEWDANGRPGDMPTLPEGLRLYLSLFA